MSGAGPHGGPTVGPATVQVVETVPVADVVTSFAYVGDVQPTETDVLIGPGRATVGWFGSLLHWRRLPIEVCEKPLPVTVSTVPWATPVLGLRVSVPTTPAADAGIASTRRVKPATKKSDATICSDRTIRARPDLVARITGTDSHSPG